MSLHPQKRPFRIIRRWTEAGVKHVEYEADFWEGPVEAGGVGGYRTIRATVNEHNVRAFVSPSVSFWSELQRAWRSQG